MSFVLARDTFRDFCFTCVSDGTIANASLSLENGNIF
jgi:hypothetical protein